MENILQILLGLAVVIGLFCFVSCGICGAIEASDRAAEERRRIYSGKSPEDYYKPDYVKAQEAINVYRENLECLNDRYSG